MKGKKEQIASSGEGSADRSAQWPSVNMDQHHPADVADHLENLDFAEQLELIRSWPPEDASESIAEMGDHERAQLISQLPVGLSADIVAVMSPDDAADVIESLDSDSRSEILRRLGQEEVAEIRNLLRFDADTAGGVMNTEVLVLDQDLTAEQAINLIRYHVEESEILYYAYVVDSMRHLKGVLSLRDLLLSPAQHCLKDCLREQNLIYVTSDVDKEEVARLIDRYDFLALPVVDHEQRMLGVVTVDDVIDIIQEEATEDIQRMVGAGADETIDSPWTYSLRMRNPWLIMNLLNSGVSAYVVHLFEGTIAEMAVLAVLMPIVANQAGNTGQQSLAVMIRQLAMEEFERKKLWKAVAREAKIGMVNGLVIGILTFFAIFLGFHHWQLAGVVAVSLGIDMVLGAVAGASIPLLLKEMGRDPAQASSIFLTTLTDSAGFLTFLGLSTLFLI